MAEPVADKSAQLADDTLQPFSRGDELDLEAWHADIDKSKHGYVADESVVDKSVVNGSVADKSVADARTVAD